MTVDISRLSFHPWKDFFGVVMQQGRVQLDSDWNEWVAELARRLQAGTMDTVGRAVVPRTTPDGFRILATAGKLSIDPGRIYVDGLLAENHGAQPYAWDPALAEIAGSGAVDFFAQPYLPFNAVDASGPAGVFNRPVLAGGPHLVYLDVWQRQVTHLQYPELVEKAVGVDTTARVQTVWQVKLLPNIGGAVCVTEDADVPGWPAIIKPSGARLTSSTGDLPGDTNPCLIPPSAGYKGLENQLYRVEIHRGGPQGSATFKWSRDNASVATRVTEIQGGTRLVVESLGRDEVLGFHAGVWIEVFDDWHELHGRPGLLRRIRPGNGVDAATRSILLDVGLPAGLFPVDSGGQTVAARNTRIRRWDQSGVVRRADGAAFHDLDGAASSDGIPVPAPGAKIALENGILVDFDLADGGEFKAGDHWVFAARTTDGTLELLDHAPPRGMHHHYARLAVVAMPDAESDCRVLWPPENAGESCDCTVCVNAEAHNAGTATIQQAIDAIRTRGGTICLDAGRYRLDGPLNLEGVRSLRIRGQGWRTLLQPSKGGAALNITQGVGVAIESLALMGATGGKDAPALINVINCVDLQLNRLAVVALSAGAATGAAIGLSGLLLGGAIRDCTLVGDQGIVGGDGKRPYLLSANLRICDNTMMCSRRGVSFVGTCIHYGETRVAANLVLLSNQAGIAMTGGAFPAATVTITDNVLNVTGNGIVAGTAALRIVDNDIVGSPGRSKADGIVLAGGLDKGVLDHAVVTGNRIRTMMGDGIAISTTLGQAMIKSNVVERVGGAALIMERQAGAGYLCVENNHFRGLGVGFNSQSQPYYAVQIFNARRGDILGNVIADVARQANQTPLRGGLIAVASSELRIAGNRLFGIGPREYIGRTIAIAVDAYVNRLSIDDNSVTRAGDDAEDLAEVPWQAIVVSSAAAGKTGGATTTFAPVGVYVMALKSNIAYLSELVVAVQPFTLGSAAVKGNVLRGQMTVAPLVQVAGVGGFRFDQNDGEISSTESKGAPPVGQIACEHAGASNNRLATASDSIALQIAARSFAVLGNLSTGPIHINGSSLPAPWAALNVQI